MSKDPKKCKGRAKVYSFIPTGEYYFHKGLEAYDRFDFPKAKKYLKRALELEPMEPMIACQLALVYTETGEYARSNELLLTILNDMDERMTECHYFLANNYAHLGVYSEAYRHVRLYLDTDEVGEFAEDAEDLLEWINRHEDEAESSMEQETLLYMQEKSKAMLEDGHYQEAVKLLKKLIKSHPDFWPAYNNMALAYFYEGNTHEAFRTLEKVLDQNKGNLHALCNLAVFYYYEQKTEQLQGLLKVLEKIQPLNPEHRYKLGATFALTKRYEKAYFWLKKLQKTGYAGSPGYYYWLSKAAFFTGNKKTAEAAWNQLMILEPQNAGSEPWNEDVNQPNGEDNHYEDIILKLLRSHNIPERLCAIFFMEISGRKNAIISHPSFKPLEEFTFPEKAYLATILQMGKGQTMNINVDIKTGHETALELYEQHAENHSELSVLLVDWFAAFQKMLETGEKLTNPLALAAATEYLSATERKKKKTQREIAKQYGISPATLRKYTNKIADYFIRH
ncbi:tetratricopeptide repeat protein [Siminovitchia sp. 179-K 8D1 HS]|uniref:tetratricopeptide repeat protein n=1 Tax=Siminovitchia sp. 179-K 8D1 HS TaxID=3142385 RepID=UPI0039A00BF1